MQLEDLKGTLEMPFATVNVVAMRLRLLHKVATTCPQYLELVSCQVEIVTLPRK